MRIIEVFNSIDGEGTRTGKLVTFIRTFSCNLRCSFCDTSYSYGENPYKEMHVDDVIEEVKKYSTKLVTLTGGEPLIHEDIDKLMSKLTLAGYEVNIETNGSVPLRQFFTFNHDYPLAMNNLIFTMDWKSPSSGMNDRMVHDNLFALRDTDVLKFVVGSKEDLDEMRKVVTENHFRCKNIYLSPVWGKIEMSEIVDYMKEYDLNQCTIQMQLHKIIWPVEMRGV